MTHHQAVMLCVHVHDFFACTFKTSQSECTNHAIFNRHGSTKRFMDIFGQNQCHKIGQMSVHAFYHTPRFSIYGQFTMLYNLQWVGSEIKQAISKSAQKVLSTCPYEKAGKSTLTHWILGQPTHVCRRNSNLKK